MGAAGFYGLMPVIHRSHEIAQQESRAAQIAARVTEQVAMLKPTDLTAATLGQLKLNDPNQGNQPWTITHIPLDDGTDYSPAKVLKSGTGTISTSNIAQGSVLVTVTIAWKSPSGKARSLTTGTVVGGYR